MKLTDQRFVNRTLKCDYIERLSMYYKILSSLYAAEIIVLKIVFPARSFKEKHIKLSRYKVLLKVEMG